MTKRKIAIGDQWITAVLICIAIVAVFTIFKIELIKRPSYKAVPVRTNEVSTVTKTNVTGSVSAEPKG